MPRLIVFHEVQDGESWARAWEQGAGSRHEMFSRVGASVSTFRDPGNPERTGALVDVPDMASFETFMASDEAARAMEEDGLKIETMRILEEFTP